MSDIQDAFGLSEELEGPHANLLILSAVWIETLGVEHPPEIDLAVLSHTLAIQVTSNGIIPQIGADFASLFEIEDQKNTA